MNGELYMFNKKNIINSIPNHVAIIMDGNRTWAKRRGLASNLGHRKGAKTLKDAVLYANEIGIKYLTVYAFSTENWSRSKQEVDYLMKLPTEFIDEYQDLLIEKGIRLIWVGNKDRLPNDVITKITDFEERSKHFQGLKFVIAFNYGGRDEIIRAVNNIIKDKVIDANNSEINEEVFESYLSTKDIPDVDLLIRTSNQIRISNFLLWKIAYSEMYFTETLWPDFNKKEFDKALIEFGKRERRYGGSK
jgi:undecaprenyl diphosphate synthase